MTPFLPTLALTRRRFIQGATAAFLVLSAAILGRMHSGAHEEADDLVALLLQQVRGHGAVNPAAHRQHDPRLQVRATTSTITVDDTTPTPLRRNFAETRTP